MPWGDTALITESVKRKEKVVKTQRSALEEISFTVDPKEILAKKPEQKLNWAIKAVELVAKHTIKVNLVFDVFSNPRFILAFGPGRGSQFRALVDRNLDLFSKKQQAFLQSKECKITTFEGEPGSDAEEADPKAVAAGRTVEVFDPFEVYNQGEDKTKLKKGMYGVVTRLDKDGDALIEFWRDVGLQSGPTFSMWVFKRDFVHLDTKEKVTTASEIKINFKTTIFSKSGDAPQFKTRKTPAEDKDDKGARDDGFIRDMSPEDATRDDDRDLSPAPPDDDDMPPAPGDPSVEVDRKKRLSGLFQPDEKLRTLLEMGKQSVKQAKVDIAVAASSTHAPVKLTFKATTPKPLLGQPKDARAAARAGPELDPASVAEAAAERAASIASIQPLPVHVGGAALSPSPPRSSAQLQPRRSSRHDRSERSRSRSRSAGRALLRRIIRHDSRSRSGRQNQNGNRNRGRGRGDSRSPPGRGDKKISANAQYVWLVAGIDFIKDRARFDKHGRPDVGMRLRSVPPAKVLSWMLKEGHCREDEDFREKKSEGMLLS